jgi:hypothetical protein
MRRSLVALGVALACLSCGKVTSVGVIDDDDVDAAPDAAATQTDAAPIDAAAPGDLACATDQDCNEDPSISALHGQCFHGICICTTGHVQPSGKCGPTPPPDCAAHGGTCRQEPATCAAGELQGEHDTNMSCGDFIAAVCCMDATTCKGPTVDLVCCGASATPYEPTCVNGWKTCSAGGPTPRIRSEGCF